MYILNIIIVITILISIIISAALKIKIVDTNLDTFLSFEIAILNTPILINS